MKEVLKYSLNPVPVSPYLPDGIMQTPSPEDRKQFHVKIIDGTFFLHLFVELPTFGDLTTYIFKQLLNKMVTRLLDKTISSLLIKDCERYDSDNWTVSYWIPSLEQRRPGSQLQPLPVDQFH